MQTQNLLFDCPLCNEVIYSYILFLSYAISSVGSLLFDGRIPPWVQMDDIVGASQIQPQSAGFETDEKNLHFSMLKVHIKSV